ncbi:MULTISPECIES: DinB family protein [unclassified Pseudonocardia]|uniref:DinB family protein n=1 Tax=unclassified Pseudonocardia TaxID=2619320 RepID=UPI00096075BC|nr:MULTISPECIES: DinB family protein [unclassified Pseudonocardia]OLM14116.1 mini-circle protein [Pseudonocardia sp. Ae505_Ps2]
MSDSAADQSDDDARSRAVETGDQAATEALGGAGELATLREFLGYMRDGVIRKALDVPDGAGGRAGVPSGTSIAWIVTHLAASERFWFCGVAVDDWAEASTPPPGRPISATVADYRDAITEADTVLDCWDDLDRVLAPPPGGELSATARWVLQHMITETARHAGHADILREQIDGSVGR